MKRLILLLLVFISLKSFSQGGYPVKQNIGSDSTIITSKGAFKSRFVNWIFTDTLDANSQHIDEYPAAQIFTSTDNHIWIRSADTTTWLLFGSGGRDTVYVTDDLYVTWDATGHQIIHRFHNDGLETGTGIVSWTGTGLTFAVSPAIFYKNGIRYTTPADTITLDPADATDGRIDAIAVDTIPDVIKITGTASPTPVSPQEEESSQIILATILLNAGDLTPSNVLVDQIYNEHVESWTPTTTGTITIDFDDTNNPYIGSKAAFVSVYENNSKIRFTYSGTETVDPGETLKLFFYSNGSYLNKLRFQFFNTNAKASNSLQINQGYGLNPLDSNNYQNISIPLSAFVWSSTTFNRLVITNVGNDVSGTKGYYIDNVQLQTGINNLPAPSDYSNKVDSVTQITGSFYYWIKGVKYLIGAGSSSRFGVSGEDDFAAQNRDFDIDDKTFTLKRTNLASDYIQFAPTTHDFYLDNGTTFTEIYHSPVFANLHAQTFGGNVSDLKVNSDGNIELLTTGGFVKYSSYGTGIKTGTPAYNLQVDATGKIIESLTPFGGTIYTANNGASIVSNVIKWGGNPLTANSSIGTSAFNFTMTSSNATHAFNVINTDANANSIMASAVAGAALYGAATTGFGVRGLASGAAGIGGFFEAGTGTSALGIQAKGTANYAGYLYRVAASENDVVDILKLHRGGSTTGLGSNGIGGGIDLTAITSTGASKTAAKLIWKWTDATNATPIGQAEIWTTNSGTSARKLALTGAGALILDGYNTLPTYADEAAAAAGGLATNTVYKTAGGELRIKL